MRIAFGVWLLAAAFLGGPIDAAHADDAFYAIIFGSESIPKRPRDAHTWVTYVHVASPGVGTAGGSVAHAHTISWYPASLDVRVWTTHPEPGVNLDLHRTLALVLSERQSVDVWKPMRISRELYAASLEQWGRLERGEALYKAIDPPGGRIYDCIHANSAIDPEFGQSHYPLTRYGKAASEHLARELGRRGRQFDPSEDTSWILSSLGVDRYPVRVVCPAVVAH